MSLQEDRIAKGKCPNCGKEAAPFRLCYDCRFNVRCRNMLNRGAEVGSLTKEKRITGIYFGLPKVDPGKTARWGSTPIHLPESDRRSNPRLRGIRVDVEATLIEVIGHIGRPCTIGEIVEAWGRLRSKRADPLAGDLARIIAARDKRKRKAAKLAPTETRQQAAE